MPFEFERLAIPEVVLVTARRFDDERGYFMELFKTSDFVAQGITVPFIQDNLSHSVRGVLRGLHYQKPPQAQGKLVMALRGRIWDAAVDIRRGSPTYGAWVGRELSCDNGCMLYVPPGFAHGFCVLSPKATVLYKVTAGYAPDLERGIRWDDPQIGVEWPIDRPLLSARDAALPLLADADNEFAYEGQGGR
ncbi:MAG: dTDP-4-dehydrorhamnose 3,5-epimerase [Anaerolineae bacterium]|jgi:dTDP-4-dehydrorhamnose 3,5-epimerase